MKKFLLILCSFVLVSCTLNKPKGNLHAGVVSDGQYINDSLNLLVEIKPEFTYKTSKDFDNNSKVLKWNGEIELNDGDYCTLLEIENGVYIRIDVFKIAGSVELEGEEIFSAIYSEHKDLFTAGVFGYYNFGKESIGKYYYDMVLGSTGGGTMDFNDLYFRKHNEYIVAIWAIGTEEQRATFNEILECIQSINR